MDTCTEPYSSIILIGLMGSGKTTIGRLLAKKLGWRFVDSDHAIEERTGVRVQTIFELEGEEGFRKREAIMLAELCAQSSIVLATGGGAVLRQENRSELKKGWVVYLDVLPHILFERTRHDTARPLLQVTNPLQKLKELREERDPIYRALADYVIDGQRYNSNQAVQKILLAWEGLNQDSLPQQT